jgi:hypothetical protein
MDLRGIERIVKETLSTAGRCWSSPRPRRS